MKKNRIRLLVTLILTVAFAAGVVGNALASRWSPLAKSPTTVTSQGMSKPAARPTNGEPDGGQTIAPPITATRSLRPLGGWTGGGGISHTEWTQWIWASWITLLAR